jgi:hypothetical protein
MDGGCHAFTRSAPHQKRRVSMEENGSELEESGMDEDDQDEAENDDENDAIIREKDDSFLPRDNI